MMSRFTNSLLVVHTRISPHRNSPRNQPIRKITIHHQAGRMTIENALIFLANPATRASYNYVIGDDGRVGLCVEERDRCWGSSSGVNDHQAVVIGVANSAGASQWPISEVAYMALIELCVDICKRNPGVVQIDGLPGLTYNGTASGSLTRHDMFARTLCAGPFLSARFPQITKEVNSKLQEDDEVTPEKFNQMMNEWMRNNAALPESPWSANEGHFQAATENRVLDGSAPLGFVTREQMAAVMGRLGLLPANILAKK